MYQQLLHQTVDIYSPTSTNNGGIQTITRTHLWSFPARLSTYSKPGSIDLTQSKNKQLQVREYLLFLNIDTPIHKDYKVTIETTDYEVLAVSSIWNTNNPHHLECIIKHRE